MLEGQGLYLLKLVPRTPLQATHYSESTCAETVSEQWRGLRFLPPRHYFPLLQAPGVQWSRDSRESHSARGLAVAWIRAVALAAQLPGSCHFWKRTWFSGLPSVATSYSVAFQKIISRAR